MKRDRLAFHIHAYIGEPFNVIGDRETMLIGVVARQPRLDSGQPIWQYILGCE